MTASRSAATVPVVFTLPSGFAERHVELVGEFVAWTALPMDRDSQGAFSIIVGLEQNRCWGYRFVLDGRATMNDPEAEEFVSDGNGGHVSAVCT